MSKIGDRSIVPYAVEINATRARDNRQRSSQVYSIDRTDHTLLGKSPICAHIETRLSGQDVQNALAQLYGLELILQGWPSWLLSQMLG
jgi:hypothetical protein